MHIMSQRSTLLKIVADSIRETYLTLKSGNANYRDFSSVPPYFGFSLEGCVGWRVSWDERLCFASFIYHFLKTSLLTDKNKANQRGRLMVQLATANSYALEKYINSSRKDFGKNLGLCKGFISIFRTQELAFQAIEEACTFGIDAELLSKTEAVKLEPKLADLPLKDMYFVHKRTDQTADCAEFVRNMIYSFRDSQMVSYVNENVEDITMAKAEDKNRFHVSLSNGTVQEFDQVILAAGILTPIWARKISRKAGQICPVFPLKGYSITLFTRIRDNTDMPFLRKGLSFDSLYCTSVAPNMIRMAGFGEIVGFPNASNDGKVGPMILEKYSKFIFGEDVLSPINNTTLPCFRPMSPDDLPLVGPIRTVNGLHIHSGHGTLGWTLSLATAYCLAQDICDEIFGLEGKEFYILPDSTYMNKSYLRSDRFQIFPF